MLLLAALVAVLARSDRHPLPRLPELDPELDVGGLAVRVNENGLRPAESLQLVALAADGRPSAVVQRAGWEWVVFPPLPPGAYTVVTSPPFGHDWASQPITDVLVAARQYNTEPVVTLLPGVPVTGRVTRAGEPLGEALVRVELCGEPRLRYEYLTLLDGRFSVRVPPGRDYEVRVVAAAPTSDAASPACRATADPPAVGPLSFDLPRPGRVAGVVVDVADKPVAGCQIVARRPLPEHHRSSSPTYGPDPDELILATTDSAGRFAIERVTAGLASLTADPARGSPGPAVTVPVTPGETVTGLRLVCDPLTPRPTAGSTAGMGPMLGWPGGSGTSPR